MTIYFMGAERPDFSAFRNFATVKSDGRYRPVARCGLACSGGDEMANAIEAPFSEPSTEFWFTSWVYVDTQGSLPQVNRAFMSFDTNSDEHLLFKIDQFRRILVFRVDDDGYESSIGETFMAAFLETGLVKLDIRVSNDRGLRLYINRNEILRFDGPLGMINPISGLSLSSINLSQAYETVWSEVMVLSRDTRTLTLQTHVPLSTDPSSTWTGSHHDLLLDDDGRIVISSSLDQDALYGVSPPMLSEARVEAIKLTVRASRGENGPNEFQFGLVMNEGEVMSQAVSTDRGWKHVSQTWDRNSLSGERFTISDIQNLSIKLRS